MSRSEAVRDALREARGADPGPVRLEPAAGGCINQAAVARVGGERFFVKWNDRPLEGQFAAEAAGLHALRASGAPLVIPEPIAWSDAGPGRSVLVLEHLPPGRPGPDFEAALGRGLALLHRATDARGFGFERDTYCGATLQPNGWMDDWASFYRDRRLGHQLRLARERGYDAAAAARGERLLARLPDLLAAPAEPPALIHGDLWSGNRHVAPDGRPGLIDPAVSFSHREAELGMMVLFGGFSDEVFAAYEDVWPLAPGWRDRLPLYTLYHVLNHWNLFGGGYGRDADRIVRRFV